MPRPTTKASLLAFSQRNFEQLNALIEGYSESERNREFPEGTMNRNIRDVLAHLHHWHLMFLDWYHIGMKGEKPDMPAKGYSWKMTKDLNRMIWEKYQSVNLVDILKRFENSHREVVQIIESHSDAELFTKKLYAWTGSTSLGAYLVSATSSHYDWAIRLIKKSIK